MDNGSFQVSLLDKKASDWLPTCFLPGLFFHALYFQMIDHKYRGKNCYIFRTSTMRGDPHKGGQNVERVTLRGLFEDGN